MTMNEAMLKSLRDGMQNTDCWYGRDQHWYRGYVEEAIDLLENREEMLDEYDCYDHLFTQ